MKSSSAETIARVLTEALPYIQKFSGKTIVIKYGGNAMIDEELKSSFARDMVLLKHVGINPVVVHGGGPQIGQALEGLGKKSEFIDGLRVTDAEAMSVVENILCNVVNKEIISLITEHGGNAQGLSGIDHGLIKAKRISEELGHVGEVSNVQPTELAKQLNQNLIPVIAPIGSGQDGESLNINADIVAGKIASALNAEKLILLTNTSGVKDGDKLLTGLDQSEIKSLIQTKVIKDGMLPKVNCAWDAISNGVNKAHIIDGRVQHAVLLELFTDQGVGTLLSS